MAELKTRKNNASVDAFLKKTGDRYADCKTIVKIMRKATGKKASMWGTAIVGFGEHPLVYADGHSEPWPQAAFSPRKQALTIYGTRASPRFAALTKKLGKHKFIGGCLYIKKLDDVDVKVLDELVSTSVRGRRARPKQRS